MALTAAEYLAQFPDGIDAHPTIQVKASVVRIVVGEISADAIQSAVGDVVDVRNILDAPQSSWVSEVKATVIYLGCRAAAFDSDDAFVSDALEKNRAILNSPLYRGLRYLFTKERIVKLGATAFGMMHRGLELKTSAVANRIEEGGTWELIAPPHVVPPLLTRCYGTALFAAGEMAGLPPMELTTEVVSSTLSRLIIRPTRSS